MNKGTLKRLINDKRLRAAFILFACLSSVDLTAYFLFLTPAAAWNKQADDRHAELRKRYADAVLFKKQKNELGVLKAGIPTQKDMPLLVKDLTQIARRLRLGVAAITSDIPKRSKDGLTMLSFSFPVEGSYPDIKRFIYEIETTGRMLAIEGMDVARDQNRVKLQMRLVTYIKGSEG